ncbi:MAG: hypothetical protein KDC44_14655, partial [Phaeodactylibacter sp.]|nr:hypothetical protein [Phaeodactylibacter sp.]
MKQTKAYLLPLFYLLFFFSTSNTFAQFSTQFTNGYYTLGLNGGWSYQSSDVRANLNGFGLGLTLGRSLYHQPGSPVSFDLRGRFLYARQYGLDPTRSYDIGSNTALNGTQTLDYTQYPSDLNEPQGFVFQNHRTDVGELSLEAVLTANRLREQTGILASIYGGVGLDWYRTRIDQSDNLGQAYYKGYSDLGPETSKGAALKSLRNEVLDGIYETNADDFENYGKLGIMPSLGIELGYYLTPTFALTAGHRLTFAGTDLLDGQQWADNQNDLYHYTSLGLQWNISTGKSHTKGTKPGITLMEPDRNPSYTSDPNAFLRARIQHVNSSADVTLRLNGQPVNFTFNDE